MKRLTIAITLTTLLASPAFAKDTTSIDNPHTVFVGVGHGNVEFEYQLNDANKKDDRSGDVEFFGYRYKINDTWAVDARYMKGKPSTFSGLFHSTSKVNFDARIISARANLKLNKRWSVYGNLGLNHYDWDIVTSSLGGNVKRQTLNDKNSTGIFAATGMTMAWQRVELNVGYQLLKMGDLNADNFTVDVGFKF